MSESSRELERRAGVVDMMMSMHARLRDRYARRAQVLDLLVFGLSVVLCATALVDPKIVGLARISDDVARAVLGMVSVVIFFLSIVALLVDWKAAVGRHSRAVEALAELKAKARRLMDAPVPEAKLQEYLELYDFTVGTLAPIPDAQFVALKAYHLRKVALSREVSRCPYAPVLLLRLRLWWRDMSEMGADEGVPHG